MKSNLSLLTIGLLALLMTSCDLNTKALQKTVGRTVLTQTAKTLDAKCPQMIGKDVRLDSVKMVSDHILKYSCTMTAVSVENLDTAMFREILEPTLVEEMKGNPDFQAFVTYDVTVAYQYSDKDGRNMTTVYVTPDKYKKGAAAPAATKKDSVI